MRYRSGSRAKARVVDEQSIAALANDDDDGVRGLVQDVAVPAPRTSADCENAALALLDDSTPRAWRGVYEVWSEFLGDEVEDVLPGDAVTVNVPSRMAAFSALVRRVEIEVKDLEAEESVYRIHFADESAEPLGFEFSAGISAGVQNLTSISRTNIGNSYLAALSDAEILQVSSTTVTIDLGAKPLSGVEVRWSDAGWGADNDRNLVGRFATQSFVVPRLSRSQTYYIRQYDSSNPPKYSRYTTSLHVDYPYGN